MSKVIYAVDLTVYVPGTGLVTKYYATKGGYHLGNGNFYEPRLRQPGNFQQDIFGDGTTSGASRIGFGEIILHNADGGLDAFPTYGFDGRSMVLRKIIAGVATILMSCSMEQPVSKWDTVPIRIKDKQQLFNVPFQTTKYAGTNALPDGVEGAADIKGQPKPYMYGQVFNVAPICVNTSRLIYQITTGDLNSVDAVYDKGVPLVFGTNQTSVANLQANPPAPGTYNTCLAWGLIRLGSSPAGQVTCDATEGANAAARTAAQIAKRIAWRGIDPSEVDAADITALDTANSSVIGIYISGETTVAAVLDEVLNSVGAWYGFDSVGKLNMGRLIAPAGDPITTLIGDDILEIERLPTNDAGRGVPPYKVTLGYAKNSTVQDAASLAGRLTFSGAWEEYALPSPMDTATNKVAAFGNGIHCILGTTALGDVKATTSADGKAWSTPALLPFDFVCYAMTYAEGLFVAVGSNDTTHDDLVITTSPDGATWTKRTVPFTDGLAGRLRGITYGNDIFVTVGYYDGAYRILTSPTGVTWTAQTFTGECKTISFGNGVFMSIGDDLATLTSTDGVTWTHTAIALFTTLIGEQGTTIFANGFFISGYWDPLTEQYTLVWSADGITWSATELSGVYPLHMLYGGGLFLSPSSTSLIYTSADGINTWSTVQSPSNYDKGIQPFAGYYANGAFVLVDDAVNIYRITPENSKFLFATKEYRTVTAVDGAVLTKHPTAPELHINTLLVYAADAQNEAARVLALRKVDRDYLSVKVKSTLLPADLLGKVLKITVPRYGYDAGKLFIITGITYDYELGITTLQVWG